jgi:hypothetical protein
MPTGCSTDCRECDNGRCVRCNNMFTVSRHHDCEPFSGCLNPVGWTPESEADCERCDDRSGFALELISGQVSVAVR